jgi:hypothetical protein
MRKRTFTPFEKNKEDQTAFEAPLTKQERIDRMFELMDEMRRQNKYVFIPQENSITLKRRKDFRHDHP